MYFIWQEILFKPLLNVLIGIYNTIGLQNLGLAIVWLTIAARLALLPFFFSAERQRKRLVEFHQELAKIQSAFSNNPSVLREEQRQLFKQYNIRRWPKIFSLALQGLILLVLYQVFQGGINLAEIVDSLYAFVHVPRSINTMFLGIDIAEPSFILSFVPALILAFTIIIDHGGIRSRWTRMDLLLVVGFPLATFGILYILPSVKALFVLGSQLFSLAFRFITNFFASIAYQDKLIREKREEEKSKEFEGVPHPKERF